MKKTKETPKHETMDLGYDRTQLFKEWVQPQINRSSALSTTMTILESNGLKLTNKEILALCEKYISYLETGDISWADTVDNYMKAKELI
jgi:hypothetical protein